MSDGSATIGAFRPSAHATLQFIGRGDELKQIESAIRDESRSYIFYITAEGGTGKTRLLREVIRRLQEGEWQFPRLAFTRRLVDLYDLTLHNPEGLAIELVNALDVEPGYFKPFHDRYTELEQARRQQFGGPPETIAKARTELTDTFIHNFNWLADGQRVVVLLDTAEMLLYEPDEVQDLLEAASPPRDRRFWG